MQLVLSGEHFGAFYLGSSHTARDRKKLLLADAVMHSSTLDSICCKKHPRAALPKFESQLIFALVF